MRAFIGLMSDDSYIIFDDSTNQVACYTAEQVKSHVNEIWNLEIKNSKVVPIGIDMKRFDTQIAPVSVAVKIYKDTKGKVIGYLLASNYQVSKVREDSLLAAYEINKRNGKQMRIANLKFVYPHGKKPYIVHLGAKIPEETVNVQLDKIEEQIRCILTHNLVHGIVEVSERISAEQNKRINSQGIEPLVKSLENMGVTYNSFKHADIVNKIINSLSFPVYYWEESRPDGSVNYKRYSCNREKLMIDMSNHLDKMGRNFNKELFRFGQVFVS